MPEDSSLSRSVLAEQVKERLLQDILSGRYPPDSRIVETHVARQLGTSQAPVREALRSLEALGVVEILPFRGARVRRPTSQEVREAYAVRAELEAFGARLAVPLLTDADMEALERLLAEMHRAATEGNLHDVAVADATFHARLLEVSANRTLTRLWRSLEPYSRTYLTLLAPNADPAWTAGLHPPIVDALRKRDAAAVEAALRHHFHEASSKMIAAWERESVTEAASSAAVAR